MRADLTITGLFDSEERIKSNNPPRSTLGVTSDFTVYFMFSTPTRLLVETT